jgi:CBS domain-containing protein
MRVRDIMTTQLVTAAPETPITRLTALLLRHHVSGIPIVDAEGRVVGIVSESDLLHRIVVRAKRPRSWWRTLIAGPADDPAEFVKVHGMRAENVMTRDVVGVNEDTSVEEVAQILEERRIRRVPVLREGQLVGIVSRTDLLRILIAASSTPEAATPLSTDDRAIRERVLAKLSEHEWARILQLNVVVSDGVVHLFGLIGKDSREALKVAVEEVSGVKAVEDRLTRLPRRIENY